MNTPDAPSYRRHKAGGRDRAYVELGGKRVYLGEYNSAESRERYDRVVAEFLASGRQRAVDPAELRVVELIARFNRHAKRYYRRPDGTMTSEVANLKLATRPLRKLYGRTPVKTVRPGRAESRSSEDGR